MWWIAALFILLGIAAILASVLTRNTPENPTIPSVSPPSPSTSTSVTVTQGPIIPGAFLLDTFQTASIGPLAGHVADTGQTWLVSGANPEVQLNPGFVQTDVLQSANEIPLVFYQTSDSIYFQVDFTNLNVSVSEFSWALVNPQGDGILVRYQFVQSNGHVQLDLNTVVGYATTTPVHQLVSFSTLITSMFGVWQADGTFNVTLTDNSTFTSATPTPASYGVDRFFLNMATTNVATSFQISQVLLYSTQQPTPPTALKCLVDQFAEPVTTLLTNHIAETISPTVQQWQNVGLPGNYDDLTLNIGAPQSGVRKTGILIDGANSVMLVNYDPTVDTLFTLVEVATVNLTLDSELIFCVVNSVGDGTQLHLNYNHVTSVYTMFMGSITGYITTVNVPLPPTYDPVLNGPLTSFSFVLYPNGNIILRFNNDPNFSFSVGGLPPPSVGLFDRVFVWFSGSAVGSNYLTSIDSQLFQ